MRGEGTGDVRVAGMARGLAWVGGWEGTVIARKHMFTVGVSER